jgi:hypothetical protein
VTDPQASAYRTSTNAPDPRAACELSHDLLGDLINELEAIYGPVPAELLVEAARESPDCEM